MKIVTLKTSRGEGNEELKIVRRHQKDERY